MKQTKQVKLPEKINNQFSFNISPTMAVILEEQGEAEFEMEGKIYKLFSEEKLAQIKQEAVKCDICGSTAIDHTELKCSLNISLQKEQENK